MNRCFSNFKMYRNLGFRRSLATIRFAFLASVIATTTLVNNGFAQFGGAFQQRTVGGVKIDANGVVEDAVAEDNNQSLSELRKRVRGGKGEFAESTSRRMISLKAVQAAIQESIDTKQPLPEEIALLGGLTRIEMVLVYPEENDIVIAGPAESWTVAKDGSIVGSKSGLPIVYLEDLVVAFQTADAARQEGISCSIDPTPEGSQRLNALLDQVSAGPNFNPAAMEPAMREAFGAQKVSITGVPKTSHMARVIFAADYQMKRLGMNLTKSPVKGLPSYIEMIRSKSVKSPQSRWWMASDYNAIEHSEDSLAWKISGRGIKTMTEQEVVGKDGTRTQNGKTDALAQKWADLFTDKLDELSVKTPVFGDLRNVMDVCVVAALIQSRGLDELAQCDLSLLRGKKANIELSSLEAPVAVEPQCSFLKTTAGWVVSASGGVMVDSWSAVQKLKVNKELAQVRGSVGSGKKGWSWQ